MVEKFLIYFLDIVIEYGLYSDRFLGCYQRILINFIIFNILSYTPISRYTLFHSSVSLIVLYVFLLIPFFCVSQSLSVYTAWSLFFFVFVLAIRVISNVLIIVNTWFRSHDSLRFHEIVCFLHMNLTWLICWFMWRVLMRVTNTWILVNFR